MDHSSSSLDISSKVVIKDELDLGCEDDNHNEESEDFKIKQEFSTPIPECYAVHGRSNKVQIKEEKCSVVSISDTDENADMKEENDFVIDDYEERCCVWLKQNQNSIISEEPKLSLLSLPEGTEIIKVKPCNYSKPVRFQNNESIQISSGSKDSYRKEKRARKNEFEAIGVIWASKLLRLEETQRVLAEDLINQILKKGFFKDLTPNTALYDYKYHG